MPLSETRLGSAAGAAFRFRAGRLAGIEIARADLTLDIKEVVSAAEPLDDVEAGPLLVDMDDPRFSTSLVEKQEAVQRLGASERRFSLENRLTSVASEDRLKALPASIRASLHIAFDSGSLAEWAIALADIESWESRDASALSLVFRSGPRLSLSIAGGTFAAAGGKVEGGGGTASFAGGLEVRGMFGPGGGHIDLILDCSGATIVADTIIVCRPDQWGEAAAALSAVPGSRYVPLVVAPAVTMSDERHLALYREYRTLLDKTIERSGAFGASEFADASPDEKSAFIADEIRRLALIDLLASRRSLAKRNLMLRHALHDLGVRRAIILFQPAAADLATAAPEIDDDAEPSPPAAAFLPDGVERTILLRDGAGAAGAPGYRDLEDLARQCALLLGRDPDALGWVHARSSGIADVIAALHEARLQGALLSIAPDADLPASADPFVASGAARDGHIVLVEAREDAQSLTGALYAAHLQTGLVVTAAPQLDAVNTALRGMQQAVQAYHGVARRPVRKFSFGAIAAAARRRLFNDKRDIALQAIGAAVTAAVPIAVRQSVGDARLTAFTGGIPYGFVAAVDTDWSRKPIGHIIEDADLHLLNDFASQATLDPLAAFSIVIDPGYFHDSETEDVVASLKGRPSRTLIIRAGADAKFGTNFVLNFLGALPTEFLFFNTHGSDDGILLGNYQVRANTIPQWMQLAERPVVFNNSCLSWTGVGRQFVRIGSRAYVGTLWSVEARDAAEIGRSMVQGLIREGSPLGEVLTSWRDVAPETARAYIGVGSALAQYPGLERYRAGGSVAAAVAELTYLLSVTLVARNDADAAAAAEYLYREYVQSRRALLAARPLDSGLVIGRLINHELLELLEKRECLNLPPQELHDLVAEGGAALAASGLPEAQTAYERLDLLRLSALVLEQAGDFEGARKGLQACIDSEDPTGKIHLVARRGLVDMMLNNGQFEAAVEPSMRLRDHARASGDDWELMLALGRVAQLMKRLSGRYEEGIEAAMEGEELARKLDIPHSRATFVIDLATLLLLAGRKDEALAHAERAVRLARHSNNPIAELAAYGTLGVIHRSAGNLARARQIAQQGLERAIELNQPMRVNAFLADLAACGNETPGAAAEADVEKDLGMLERTGNLVPPLQRGFQLAHLIDRAVATNSRPLVLRAVLGTSVILVSEPSVISAIATVLYGFFKDHALEQPRDEAFALLGLINNGAATLLERYGEAETPEVGEASHAIWSFVQNITAALCYALRGDREIATRLANQLSGDYFTGEEIHETIETLLQRAENPDSGAAAS